MKALIPSSCQQQGTLGGCRSCGSDDLRPVLSLGAMPLANGLVCEERLAEPEPVYPLDVDFCPSCAVMQLRQSVPPEKLFRDYCYFSSYSDAALAHARNLAGRMAAERRLGRRSLVVEAGGNDGYLLRHYREAGIPVLEIEPARNVACVARRHNIPTVEEFFTRELADRLADEGVRADVFHAHNVLGHVPDLNGFLAGMRRLLKPDGVAVLEVPYVRDLIERCEFDTIYYEHLSYFSVHALTHAL